MAKKYKILLLNQTDQALESFKKVEKVPRPPKGWIRAIREAVGMSGSQLARRMGMTKPALFQLEVSVQ